MKYSFRNIIPIIAVHILSGFTLSFTTYGFYILGIKDEYLILAVFISIIVVLPIIDYSSAFFSKLFIDEEPEEHLINTVDEFMNISSFDDFISGKFSRILEIVSASNGILAVYNREKDQFSTFVHSASSILPLNKNYKINSRNILFEVTNSREDIIIKSKLNPEINFNKKIKSELDRLDSDIMVPIFYLDMFMGALFVSNSGKDFSKENIFRLKIFATKIASLTVNSFFWQEMVRKKELEKERSLGEKVQRNFLPPRNMTYKNIEVTVHYSNADYIIDKFYDIFPLNNQINITNYGSKEDNSNSIIFMPALKAMLQSYARLGFSAADSFKHMKQTNQNKNLIEEQLSFLHTYIHNDGKVEYVSEDYPKPFVFRENELYQVEENIFKINKDELLFLCNENVTNRLITEKDGIEKILKNEKNISIAKDEIINFLRSNENEKQYKFFAIAKVNSK